MKYFLLTLTEDSWKEHLATGIAAINNLILLSFETFFIKEGFQKLTREQDPGRDSARI